MPFPEQAPAARPISRENRDVVALIGDRRLLRAGSVVAAGPEPGDGARRRVGKDPRAADNAGFLWSGDGNLDDVDAEERGVRIVLRFGAGTAGQLFGRPHGGGTRSVDVQVRFVVRVRDERVRMRAAARLYGGHLLRLLHVGDVEDADAAKALGADRRLDALRPAVEAPAPLLDRHHEQVAVHRHVTLAAGADDRRQKFRLPRIGEIVDVEAVEIADEEMPAAERQVGVGEVQSASTRGGRVGVIGFGVRLRVGLRLGFGFGGLAGRHPGIEEAGRFGEARHELQIARGPPRVLQPGFEAHTRIGRWHGGGRRRPFLRDDPGTNQQEDRPHTRTPGRDCLHLSSSFDVISIPRMRSISIR